MPHESIPNVLLTPPDIRSSVLEALNRPRDPQAFAAGLVPPTMAVMNDPWLFCDWHDRLEEVARLADAGEDYTAAIAEANRYSGRM